MPHSQQRGFCYEDGSESNAGQNCGKHVYGISICLPNLIPIEV